MKREKAIEKIGKAPYENLFESLEGEKFESYSYKKVHCPNLGHQSGRLRVKQYLRD